MQRAGTKVFQAVGGIFTVDGDGKKWHLAVPSLPPA